MSTIRNLVISGGGAAGVYAYPGAIKTLRKKIPFENIERITGVSVGAMTALMVALKFTDEEVDNFIATIDFTKINDSAYLPTNQYRDVKNNFGFYKGIKLFEIIQSILTAKKYDPTTMTFAKLKESTNIDLTVLATYSYEENELGRSDAFYFSAKLTPDTLVTHAILASAAATPYFQSVRMKKISETHYELSKDKKDLLFSDGGFSNNFPIEFYDLEAKENETLGLILLTKAEIDHDISKKGVITQIKPGDGMKYIYALLHESKLCNVLQRLKEKKNDVRTIKIDRLGVNLADFILDKDKQKAMYQSGIDAVNAFYKTPGLENEPVPLARTKSQTSSLWFKPEKNGAQYEIENEMDAVASPKKGKDIELTEISTRRLSHG